MSDKVANAVAAVVGMAVAQMASHDLLIAALAGLVAGSLSMAAGEFVSVRSQREMYEYQIALEKEELEEYPEEEAEELALIYNARGLGMDEARAMARALLANPEQALDVLAREELGLNPEDLGSPWGAALSSFIAFSVGAVIPLMPFLAGATGDPALLTTIGLTVLSLAGIGMAISLFTGRGAWTGALRMVLIGGGAGLVSWLVGRLLGVAIG